MVRAAWASTTIPTNLFTLERIQPDILVNLHILLNWWLMCYKLTGQRGIVQIYAAEIL